MHKKHSHLKKAEKGNFGRTEIAILGAPCDRIKQIFDIISLHLSKKHHLAYLDEDHKAQKKKPSAYTYFTKGTETFNIEIENPSSGFQYESYFDSVDLCICNGNHFLCDDQILIINSLKKDSLFKKLDRLKNVKMILLDEDEEDVFDFLHFLKSSSIPIFTISKTEKWIPEIEKFILCQIPLLKGLVLTGGKSVRMGQDKSRLVYHQKPQYAHSVSLLRAFCHDVFLSVSEPNSFQSEEISQINDSFIGLGPYGGILSAFRNDPNSAWLSLACDIPLLNEKSIQKLVESRDPSKVATCFHNEETNFPEPLITIWEPKAYPRLLHFLSMGYSCPRKVLINSEIKEIQPEDQSEIKNVNTPADFEFVKQKISDINRGKE